MNGQHRFLSTLLRHSAVSSTLTANAHCVAGAGLHAQLYPQRDLIMESSKHSSSTTVPMAQTRSELPSRRKGWGRKLVYIPLVIVLAYLTALVALINPSLQRSLLYLNAIRYPFHANFSNPEKYGLAPYKTRYMNIRTSDGETLGAWHVLPHSIYRQADEDFPPRQALGEDVFASALKERPTIIYFHGNAANRALSHRVKLLSDFSTKLNCNAIAIDYRGFADSTGSPTESGLLQDATAVWDWVVERTTGHSNQEGSNIALVGHSLGTAVTSKLVGWLGDRDIHPRATVLIAPFTSVPELLLTYRIAGIPLISPLKIIPDLQRWVLTFLQDEWWTSRQLVKTKSPLLIVHAKNDIDIPSAHSQKLFNIATIASAGRTVSTSELDIQQRTGWGQVTKWQSPHGQRMVWFEGEYGAHNQVAVGEGVIDLIHDIVNP